MERTHLALLLAAILLLLLLLLLRLLLSVLRHGWCRRTRRRLRPSLISDWTARAQLVVPSCVTLPALALHRASLRAGPLDTRATGLAKRSTAPAQREQGVWQGARISDPISSAAFVLHPETSSQQERGHQERCLLRPTTTRRTTRSLTRRTSSPTTRMTPWRTRGATTTTRRTRRATIL